MTANAAQKRRGAREAGPEAPAAEPFEQWPEDVDFGVLSGLIGYALRRAQIAIYRDFSASMPDFTPPLFAALVLIDQNPGLTQTRLGQVMGVNRAAAMALIDRLVDLNLVVRHVSVADKRANSVRLTDLGCRRLAAASLAVREHDARIARNLTARERDTLRSLLRKF